MSPTFNLKKHLGQHFLCDDTVGQKIAQSLQNLQNTTIEIGPGNGALTKWLVPRYGTLYLVELDQRFIAGLSQAYGGSGVRIVNEDILKWSLDSVVPAPLSIIGNLPYNISSQIFFKILDSQHLVEEVVCMVQHEVAARITAQPGSRIYGILSVLLQAFYHAEYLFSVPPTAFEPPPKVTSGVIRLVHRANELPCSVVHFRRVVKAGFQQRRKKLRNALTSLGRSLDQLPAVLMDRRAEQLSVEDFIGITQGLYP